MAYPKPLSEKSIKKLYTLYNINDTKKDFLHDFFQAASNLYGCIMLEELWDVYKIASTKCKLVKISKTDLINFSQIARREKQPYYIYEIDELYKEEHNKISFRYIINNQLLYDGYNRFREFYFIDDKRYDYPQRIPENIMAYSINEMTKKQKELLDFIGNLKCTLSEYVTDYGKKINCSHVGECLKDFVELIESEKFNIRYLSGELEGKVKKNDAKIAKYISKRRQPYATRIYNRFMLEIRCGYLKQSDLTKIILEYIQEMGVSLSLEEIENIIKLMVEVNNSTNLWCLYGWSPDELSEYLQKK